MNKNILIITGEPSGDIRAGELLKELKKLLPDVSFWGIGGDSMESEGVELTQHIRDLSLVGAVEVIKSLPKIREQYTHLTEAVKMRKPHLAILIDYPGFNLRVAKFLKEQNIPVIYYIIPQVWAWGRWRIKTLKRCVSKALVLFKFEEVLLKKSGVECEFVGHPLVDKTLLESASSRPFSSDRVTVSLLPGSRKSEISRIFPVMLEAAKILKKEIKGIRFIVAESSNVNKALYDELISKYKELPISRVKDNTFKALKESDFAIVTSGTATLEAAITEKPMVITYKAPLVTALLYFLLREVKCIGLVNVIAGKKIVPELLQWNSTPKKMAHEALKILKDPSLMKEMEENLRCVKNALGEKGAEEKAARATAALIKEKGLF